MRIKICGLFRDEDIDIVNEARPDYTGFVFTKSSRQISPVKARQLRSRLSDRITPVGVFLNSPVSQIIELYQNGTIAIAQLHGDEDDDYIFNLKKETGTRPIPVIKTVNHHLLSMNGEKGISSTAQYILIDSGAGSGQPFDWKQLNPEKMPMPWFLAGGINIHNIKQAIELNPFAVDVSSGAERDGIKNREKIIELVNMCRSPGFAHNTDKRKRDE